MTNLRGTLYIVATPIGNLSDMSARAIETLQAVDLILAEDTRVSRKLLSHFGVSTPMQSYHDHNERQAAVKYLEYLLAGRHLALVSDAGTPSISDPGLHLVALAHENEVPVRVIPGPSSVTAALSVSGLAVSRFAFEGFLPARSAARRSTLQELRDESRALVFLESPHRLLDSLQDLVHILGGQRQAFVTRELTKLFESHRYGTLAEILASFQGNEQSVRGEFVIVVAASQAPSDSQAAGVKLEQLLEVLVPLLPAGQAAKAIARLSGESRNSIYQRIQNMNKGQ